MATSKKSSNESKTHRQRPATTIEGRENQMIALAIDQAEKDLREGKASPSVVIHFLKLATTKEQLEKEKLIEENRLLKAKTEALTSAEESKEMYLKAINAFKRYSGNGVDDDISEF